MSTKYDCPKTHPVKQKDCCPHCGRALAFDDDRDSDGEIQNAWLKCEPCDYYIGFRDEQEVRDYFNGSK